RAPRPVLRLRVRASPQSSALPRSLTSENRDDPSSDRTRGRSFEAPAVPPAFTIPPPSRQDSCAHAALTGGPGPVHRPLTGGGDSGLDAGLAAMARLSVDLAADRASR